jgi:hypothetical protein
MTSYSALDRECKCLYEPSYDGTGAVEVYLMKFEYFVCRLLRLNRDIEDEELRMTMYIHLQNAKKPPALSPIGE